MLGERKYKGFSLIEILIVVGLILILAAVTIVAINPAKHFRDTRNAERKADISEILNAVTQYTAEDGKTLADLNLGTEVGEMIPSCADGWDGAADIADVVNTGLLVPAYIVEIPRDPQVTGDDIGYRICESGAGRVEIRAQEEGTTELSTVTR
jgi:prepilin-type N-terminal cleavage/methylation domain-containing protein